MNNPVYRGSYSDALTMQANVIARLRNPINRSHGVEQARRYASPDIAKAMPSLYQYTANQLPLTTPIFWSSDLPVPEFDDGAFQLTVAWKDFPVERGFLYFEDPFVLGATQPIGGLAWFPVEFSTGTRKLQFMVLNAPFTYVPNESGVLASIIFDPAYPLDAPQADDYVGIDRDRLLAQQPSNFLHALDNHLFVRLFDYCLDFMRQRVKVELAPESANRTARKHAKRLGYIPSDVLIVQYRRTEPRPPSADHEPADGQFDTEHRRYAVQFPVIGHWRLQRCGPGRQTIRRVWVREHLKGPQDAPVVQRKRLLTVVR